ncbi:ER membrane protein complex subunit 8/9-like [Vitis vinifera]|uniref:ER membrane protein complex subunit 8/9-like n=1 Tax=Vitis vinifera TaxID=29760 RepID=A0A438K0T0_VITVI|nr:ER membrane protein complex subunit 8/9-like [Vitis vinifera]
MASPDRELERQLMEAGNKLLVPPASVNKLLPLLDQVENRLLKVEQLPSMSMQNALSALLKAMVTDQLLRHSDVDVKVVVAACISEITRTTAPDAPYDDDQMKEFFQLIHFLNAIRDDHPANVFTSMETIMTLVVEESEDIPIELLSPILVSIKDNQEVLPIAWKLGEKVFENFANMLKPCLIRANDDGVPEWNDDSAPEQKDDYIPGKDTAEESNCASENEKMTATQLSHQRHWGMSLHMLLLHPQAGAYLMRVAQHIQDDWNPSKTAQNCLQIQLYTKDASKNWRHAGSDGSSQLTIKEPSANVVLLDYIASEKWQDIIDFDDHLDDISKDWLNPELFK